MRRKGLVECTFLIPLRRDPALSDGRRHGRLAWAWLHEELNQFGGGTRSRGLYVGWYLDPDTGKRVEDLSRKYFVAVPNRNLRQLWALLRRACDVFGQKCIYLSVAGPVEFVRGASHETE